MIPNYILCTRRLVNFIVTPICRKKSVNFAKTMENSHKIKLSERLSSLVRPRHYQLYLNPNLETGLFHGEVKIDINVKEDKQFLALHTKFLDINYVKLYKNDVEISVSKFLEVKSLEQLLIQFDKITSGNYQLEIKFSGNLTRNIVGFYLSHLKNKGYLKYLYQIFYRFQFNLIFVK